MDKKIASNVEIIHTKNAVYFTSNWLLIWFKQILEEFIVMKFVVTVDNKITTKEITPNPDNMKISQISVIP